jgi:TonB-linked SusC/RagA family outer membrane protein
MRYCLLFILLCAYANLTKAQATRTVRGTVTDSVTGQPMSGVIITNLRGQRFATDYRGYFIAQLPMQNDTLRFSYLGYTTRRMPAPFNQPEALTVILSPRADKLEDVVVNTGYQQLPKERATGSFSQVSRAILEEQVSTDLISRLEGTANALQIDRKSSSLGDRITIRGLSTISGPRSPLIILDNFPYEGELNNINPNDIETVTLLKDAAAASIWGTRAGNGVLVITTKKGRFEQPTRVDFNMNITSGAKPDLYALKSMSSSDYIDLEQYLYGAGYYNNRINSTARTGLTPVVELLLKKSAGVLSASEADARINALRNVDTRDDFAKWIYRPTLKQQYSLSVRGGSKQQAWIISAGIDRNRSELDDIYQRVNLRIDNSVRWGKTTIQTGFFFTETIADKGKTGMEAVAGPNTFLYPYAQLADANGNALPISRLRQGYIDTAGGGRLLNWDYYPLQDMNNVQQSTRQQSLVISAGIQRPVLPGIQAELKYQYEKQYTDNKTLQDENSYFARDLVNKFSQINYATGAVTYRVPKGGILDPRTQQLQSHSLRGQLNYQQRWASQEFVLLAGGEYRGVDNSNYGDRIYGYIPTTIQQDYVDYLNPYPNFITKASQYIPRSSSRSATTNRYLSVYGNAAYTYRRKYTLSASLRKDASNLFGVSTNDKWSPLFSVGASWQISQETFYKISWLPQLKGRITYGKSGNTDPSRTAVTTISYLGTSPYTQSIYASVSQPPNPLLRWEKVATWNFGLDFASRNQRISGSLEYYIKNGIDLFGASPVDYTAVSNTSLIRNTANIVTKGIDIELQTVNTTGIVKWSTNLNLNLNRDKVLSYFVVNKAANRFVSSATSLSINPLEGYPVYGVFAYRWLGLDPQNGNPIGVLNGQPSTNYSNLIGASTLVTDVDYMGAAFPRVSGSLRNAFQWKQFQLSFNLMFRMDYYFRKSTINYNQLMTNGLHHADYGSRWRQPGDELVTTVPSFVYPAVSARDEFYAGATPNVIKGDHVRLQYVNLSYDVNGQQLKKIGWQRLQFYLNLQNLGILWRANKEGLDPEYFNNNVANLPPARTISFGIRAQF